MEALKRLWQISVKFFKFSNFLEIKVRTDRALKYLTHWLPVLPSYRNQLIDLHSKSVDWFLYEDNTGN